MYVEHTSLRRLVNFEDTEDSALDPLEGNHPCEDGAYSPSVTTPGHIIKCLHLELNSNFTKQPETL